MKLSMVLWLVATVWAEQHCLNYEFVDQAVAGDRLNPFPIAQGCFYDFMIPPGGALHLKMEKPECPTCDLFQEWFGVNAPGKVLALFSWEAAKPSNEDSDVAGGSALDTTETLEYQWSMQLHLESGDHVYRAEAPKNESVLFCKGLYCHERTKTAQTGPLFITLKSHSEEHDVYGVYSSSFHKANRKIKKEQLIALENLWRACCEFQTDGHDPEPEHMDQSHCSWSILTNPLKSWADVTTKSCDDMPHIACDSKGNVAHIRLDHMGLRCSALPSMHAFTHLRALSLANNYIGGELEPSLVASRTLETLGLANNFITGRLPCFESRVLQSLYLNENNLTGTLPLCLGHQPQLKELDLSDNHFTGPIPGAWRKLAKLEVLLLSRLQLKGGIPQAFRSMHELRILDLSRNRLSGTVPDFLLSELNLLHHVDLSFNKLDGEVPHVHPSMTNLVGLFLNDNRLQGRLTTQLDAFELFPMESAAHVKLSHNRLSGRLHDAVRSAATHVDMDLSGNIFSCDQATGDWPMWVRYTPIEVGTCLPEPIVQSVYPKQVKAGGSVEVTAKDLLASENLRCVFGDVSVKANFIGEETAQCQVPDTVAGHVPVTVTNMGPYYEPMAMPASGPEEGGLHLDVVAYTEGPGIDDAMPMHNAGAVIITLVVFVLILAIAYACLRRRRCLWAKRGLAVATEDEIPINGMNVEGLAMRSLASDVDDDTHV